MVSRTEEKVNHKDVVAELNALGPELEGLNLDAPRHIEVRIAADRIWTLRNTYVQDKMIQRLARLRGSTKEASSMGKRMDSYVKDITELYRLYPETRDIVAKMDAPPPKEEALQEE